MHDNLEWEKFNISLLALMSEHRKTKLDWISVLQLEDAYDALSEADHARTFVDLRKPARSRLYETGPLYAPFEFSKSLEAAVLRNRRVANFCIFDEITAPYLCSSFAALYNDGKPVGLYLGIRDCNDSRKSTEHLLLSFGYCMGIGKEKKTW